MDVPLTSDPVAQDSPMMTDGPASLDNSEIAKENSAVSAAEQAESEDSFGPVHTGQVKWFDDQLGYGFIKTMDGSSDCFVHIKDIRPSAALTGTLYTGEYVTFFKGPNGIDQDGNPRTRALVVKGIERGSLMCDQGSITFRSYSRFLSK